MFEVFTSNLMGVNTYLYSVKANLLHHQWEPFLTCFFIAMMQNPSIIKPPTNTVYINSQPTKLAFSVPCEEEIIL
eukprot:c41915_g1_i1 orf=24-248(-)